jgi:flagellar secretion chaperone FliS
MSVFARQAASAYRQTEIQSRTPLELVVMLYDGALRFGGQARVAIVRKDIRARREAISRTLAILSELQATLDLEKGGEIATSLDKLYVYIIGRFLEAAAKQDVRPLDEALSVLTTLRGAWAGIALPTLATGTRAGE